MRGSEWLTFLPDLVHFADVGDAAIGIHAGGHSFFFADRALQRIIFLKCEILLFDCTTYRRHIRFPID